MTYLKLSENIKEFQNFSQLIFYSYLLALFRVFFRDPIDNLHYMIQNLFFDFEFFLGFYHKFSICLAESRVCCVNVEVADDI